MKYSDLKRLTSTQKYQPLYRLCHRRDISPKTGKFAAISSWAKDLHPFDVWFNRFGLSDKIIDELFSEEGDCMLVECKNDYERVVLPAKLKQLFIEHFGTILADYQKSLSNHRDGSLEEDLQKRVDCIKKHIH